MLFQTKTKHTADSIIDFLTAEGLNNPINRGIIHLLQLESKMLYSDLVLNLGIDHIKFAGHINQLIRHNIINRDINNSTLCLNKQYIRDKGYKI